MARATRGPLPLPSASSLRIALAMTAVLVVVVAPEARGASPPPEMPPATYEAVEEQMFVRMDDGVRLGATVTFPSRDGDTRAPGRFPVVLQTTPYGREGACSCIPGAEFATRGMVGAVVDVRGTGGSEGTLEGNYFSPREARDGRRLVEFFGTRRYSNGRVGMTGGSYLGITQYLTAARQPPHLKAITPVVALSDLYREGYTHEGIPNFFFDMQYLGVQQPAGFTGFNTTPGLLGETAGAKIQQVGGSANVPFDYLSRPNDGRFYRARSPLYGAHRIEVPALIIDGWRDGFIFGANEMYRVLSKRRGVETRLYVDPCTHKGCGPPFAPLTNPPNRENVEAVVFEFLRKHLMPGTRVPHRPRARVYVQGRQSWMDRKAWPPPDSRLSRLYLSRSGLTRRPPASAGSKRYLTNPADGLSMTFDQYGTVAASPYIPLDQRLAQEAGLTWRTPALKRRLTLTGESALHLVAASSASDTDWFAKLSDVAPDGSESIVTAGFLRASHRRLDESRSTRTRPWHQNTRPRRIEPGRYYSYDLAIWPTAYELGKGHRLQLRLTSYDFPTHLPGTIRVDPERPRNTWFTPLPPAANTVRLGGANPSYLLIRSLDRR